MDAAPYLAALRAAADPARIPDMAAYHKIDRPYLGLKNGQIDDMTKSWRRALSVADRVDLAGQLWRTNIYEARLAAAKLHTQARIRPDAAVWAQIVGWVPDFDSWAIADHVCMAGQKRLVADPARLDEVEAWTVSDHMWTRRAALVITLPWTKQNHPKPEELVARDRILGWAAGYVADRDWFIQKAIAWWLRELSKHDAPRVLAFLDQHGPQMKAFARKEAARHLAQS
jgi:3-methyladenine DNA glycosylase AlkD